MSRSNFQQSSMRNRGRPCIARGCGKTRHGVGQYCSKHTERKRLYGHEEGRSIRLAEVEGIYKVVLSIIKETRTQCEMKDALATVDSIIFNPGEPPRGSGRSPEAQVYDEQRRMLAALQRHEVSVEGVAARIFAVWFFSDKYERKLPSDMRLTFALARIALTSIERPVTRSTWNNDEQKCDKVWKEPPSGALQILGQSLRRRLAAFWTQCMSDAITKRSSEMLKGAATQKQVAMNPLALQPYKVVKRPRAIHHVTPIDPNSRMARAEEEAKKKPKYIKPEAIVPVKDEDPEIEEVVTDEELHATAREMKLDLNYAIGQTRARQEVLARRQR